MSSPAIAGEEEEEESVQWSRDDEKTFEDALATATFPSIDGGDSPSPAAEAEDRWLEEVASRVPGKTLDEVKKQYRLLTEDVKAIDSGKVPIPRYSDDSSSSSPRRDEIVGKKICGFSDRKEKERSGVFDSGGHSKSDLERKKGIPWTEEEHRLFLLGLEKFGKGDWRSISRNFVVTRTPTQVASHAQKYFIRLNSINRDRRRSSIHDITNVNGGDSPHSQGPITGQGIANSSTPAVVNSYINHPQQQPNNMPAMGIYGAPMGHPVPGHMVSAVGTPIMLPPGHSPYVMPVAYPIPPTMHH